MALEIERKYPIDAGRMKELTQRLEELGARFLYEAAEENFLHRGGLLDTRNAALRLRKTKDKTVLTYKEKVSIDGDFKQQIEFETEVSNSAAAENIIERLGYKLALVYEKKRRAWRMGGVEVVLDELPFGLFMEIEGEKTEIMRAEELLGAQDLTPEMRGYPSLTLENGINVNGVIEARFRSGDLDR